MDHSHYPHLELPGGNDRLIHLCCVVLGQTQPPHFTITYWCPLWLCHCSRQGLVEFQGKQGGNTLDLLYLGKCLVYTIMLISRFSSDAFLHYMKSNQAFQSQCQLPDGNAKSHWHISDLELWHVSLLDPCMQPLKQCWDETEYWWWYIITSLAVSLCPVCMFLLSNWWRKHLLPTKDK